MRHRFEFLDGLRGVAAISVVIFHSSSFLFGKEVPSHGFLAVDFFFILSGFVLGHAYEQKIRSGQLTAGPFLLSRAIRLWPLLVAGSLLGAGRYILGILVHRQGDLWQLTRSCLATMFLIPWPRAMNTELLFPVNGPTWSLLYEILASSALFWISPRISTTFLKIIVGMAAICFIYVSQQAGTINGGYYHGQAIEGTSRAIFGFSTGLLLWRLHRSEARNYGTGSAIACVAALLLAFAMPTPDQWVGVQALLAAIVLPLVVWHASHVNLSGRLLQWSITGGLISYPLYLLHLPILDTFRGIWVALGTPSRIATGIIYLTAIATALLAARLAVTPDRMTRAWLKNKLSGKG